MKVVCKTNISLSTIKYDLTVGKVYEAILNQKGEFWVYVIDDSGAKEHYHEYMFTPLVELRNEKIEELLK